MSQALQTMHRMTVAEFQDWRPPSGLEDLRWELVDGEPVCMAPASENHGAIQNEVGRLLGNHLALARRDCRVIAAPGVVPPLQSATNERITDIGVTCSPALGKKAIADPVLLIEILSPSNEAKTRANVWTYCAISSVSEVLLLSSTSVYAELLQRQAGQWPATAAFIARGEMLRLDSIDFATVLDAFYRTTSLLG